MPVLTRERFDSGFSWKTYMENSVKNLERLHENYDHPTLSDDDAHFFSTYDKVPVSILILAEDWCGDVVQSLPQIIRLIELSPAVTYRIFRRDENLDLMDCYLTDGSRGIPYLVFMDKDLNERERWGPRPIECQAIMRNNKGKIPMDEIYPKLRQWYKGNGQGPLIREIRAIFEHLVN